MITILNNPRCGKSREALQMLEKSNLPFEVRLYLKNPMSEEELKKLVKLEGINIHALIRKKEPVAAQYDLSENAMEEDLITILASNPVLIERPTVFDKESGVVARPLERLVEWLKKQNAKA
jgi:arsenate reductase